MPVLHIHLEVKVSGKLGADRLLDIADVAEEAVMAYDDPAVTIHWVNRVWHLETGED